MAEKENEIMRNKTMTRKTDTSRKILTVIMTALVVSMLAACGSSNTSGNTSASGSSNASEIYLHQVVESLKQSQRRAKMLYM